MSEENIVKLCPTRRGVLKYGEVLTDDEFKAIDWKNKQGKNYAYHWIRVRVIKYENKLYYHKMVNGETVGFKELI